MILDDTICAVSTPAGEGGIGIIRVSGKSAVEIAAKIVRTKRGAALCDAATHRMQYGWVLDPATEMIIDEVLVCVMRAPATYTREDVVEVHCHGGMMPMWTTMQLLIAAGARQAEPGEFTKRAFLNGRIDLAQAEAVMEIIQSKTELSRQAAAEQLAGGLSREVAGIRDRMIGIIAGVEAGVDFPEEDIETPSSGSLQDEIEGIIDSVENLLEGGFYGKVLRDGFAAAIVGRPNVGKSSLLNALLRADRAIVTDIPGTTRDVLEEYLNIGGLPVKILDTAGIRHSEDVVEQEGVKRSLSALERADVVLIVLDGSCPLDDEDRRVLDAVKGKSALAVINKKDLPTQMEPISWPETQIAVSCRTGGGLGVLRDLMAGVIRKGAVIPREHAWAVNQRHYVALEKSKTSLMKARDSARRGLSPEFVALDLRDALDSMGLVIGATYTDDILEKIFGEFCIGK